MTSERLLRLKIASVIRDSRSLYSASPSAVTMPPSRVRTARIVAVDT